MRYLASYSFLAVAVLQVIIICIIESLWICLDFVRQWHLFIISVGNPDELLEDNGSSAVNLCLSVFREVWQDTKHRPSQQPTSHFLNSSRSLVFTWRIVGGKPYWETGCSAQSIPATVLALSISTHGVTNKIILMNFANCCLSKCPILCRSLLSKETYLLDLLS